MAINPPGPTTPDFYPPQRREDEYPKYNAATNRDLLKELFKTRIEDGYSLKRSDRKEVHVYISPRSESKANSQSRSSSEPTSVITHRYANPRTPASPSGLNIEHQCRRGL